MKVGSKIVFTGGLYWESLPKGTIMTVEKVFSNGCVNAGKYHDGRGLLKYLLRPSEFHPHTPDMPYGHVTLSDGRVVDLTANRVPCGLMDAEEQQALKDHGGPYEFWYVDEWEAEDMPSWNASSTYRVAPKPDVETVVIYGELDIGVWQDVRQDEDTHKITMTIQDGQIIDIKAEEL